MNSFAFGLLIFWGFLLKKKKVRCALMEIFACAVRIMCLICMFQFVHALTFRWCLWGRVWWLWERPRANESARRRGPQSERTVATSAKWSESATSSVNGSIRPTLCSSRSRAGVGERSDRWRVESKHNASTLPSALCKKDKSLSSTKQTTDKMCKSYGITQ